jgi:hypothetical protein
MFWWAFLEFAKHMLANTCMNGELTQSLQTHFNSQAHDGSSTYCCKRTPLTFCNTVLCRKPFCKRHERQPERWLLRAERQNEPKEHASGGQKRPKNRESQTGGGEAKDRLTERGGFRGATCELVSREKMRPVKQWDPPMYVDKHMDWLVMLLVPNPDIRLRIFVVWSFMVNMNQLVHMHVC